MPSIGTLIIYAYASNARLPLPDVAIAVEDNQNKLIAMGLTDKSGKYGPISITVPDRVDSLTPGGQRPFSTVNLHARLENYEQIEADNIQVFPNTITQQNLEMIPLAELPDQWTKSELFNTPAQNL